MLETVALARVVVVDEDERTDPGGIVELGGGREGQNKESDNTE